MRKPKNPKLTVAQTCMYSNFCEAAVEYPRENFDQITRRLLGKKGFPVRAVAYKSECRKAFDLGRRG
jgi:hypothetical protein